MHSTLPLRKGVGGLATALLVAVAILVNPVGAATAADTSMFVEIQNRTWLKLTLGNAFPPANGRWTPAPPATVGLGQRGEFGVTYDSSPIDKATVSYRLEMPDGTTGLALLSVAAESSSCSTDLVRYECTFTPASNGSVAKFVFYDRWPDEKWVAYKVVPGAWGTVLNKLCLTSGYAKCIGPEPNAAGLTNWIISIGRMQIDLDAIQWAGTDGALAGGTRGNPYQQAVGSPKALQQQFGYYTTVSGLPAGLKYFPEYDAIMGTPSGPPGTSTVTIKLMAATNVLSIGTRTLTITQTPTVLTTKLAAAEFASDVFYQLRADTGVPRSAATMTVTGLPIGLSFDPTTWMISGTPLKRGTFSIVITVTTPGGTATKTLPLVVRS